jgi:hypothetical protein
MYKRWMKKSMREVGNNFEDDGNVSRPNVKVNTKVPDELRNAEQLSKRKSAKDNNKLKNMAKDKRKKIEKREKEKHQQAKMNSKKFAPTKGSSKIRCIVRM